MVRIRKYSASGVLVVFQGENFYTISSMLAMQLPLSLLSTIVEGHKCPILWASLKVHSWNHRRLLLPSAFSSVYFPEAESPIKVLCELLYIAWLHLLLSCILLISYLTCGNNGGVYSGAVEYVHTKNRFVLASHKTLSSPLPSFLCALALMLYCHVLASV